MRVTRTRGPRVLRTVGLIGFLGPVLLAAGCGSGKPDTPAGAEHSPSQARTEAVAYSRCMRSHGVPNFPDPQVTGNGHGVNIKIAVQAGTTGAGTLNPRSPAFQSADAACHHLLPDQGQPSGPVSAQQRTKLVQFADCMRAHGVPNFPDPTADGTFDLPSQIDANAPGFQSAMQKCQRPGLNLGIRQVSNGP